MQTGSQLPRVASLQCQRPDRKSTFLMRQMQSRARENLEVATKRRLQNIVRSELIKSACFDLCIPHSTKGPLAVYQGGQKDRFVSRTLAEVHKGMSVLFHSHVLIFHLQLLFILNFEPKSKGVRNSGCKRKAGVEQASGVTGHKYWPPTETKGRGEVTDSACGCVRRFCVNISCMSGR